MDVSAIQPIIIIGVNRNGTTLLANTIIKNFKVAALHHPLHFGFFESNIYVNDSYYGTFETKEDFEQFLEIYAQTDAFAIAGIEKEWFLNRTYTRFIDFFLDLHEELCRRSGSNRFLLKFDPGIFAHYSDLKDIMALFNHRYASLKFICIKRDFEEYLSSQVHMNNTSYSGLKGTLRKGLKKWTASAYYHYFYKKMQSFNLRYSGMHLKFKELTQNKEKTLEKISSFIELPFTIRSVVTIQNTSHHDPQKIPRTERAPLNNMLFLNFPLLGGFTFKIRSWVQSFNKQPILYYRLHKAEHNKEELKKEFLKKGYLKLLPFLEEDVLKKHQHN